MGTIDDYLAELDDDSRAAVRHVYDIALEVVPDAEQGKGYGMPALIYRGKALLAVMRAKEHVGVYPFSPDAITAVAPDLEGFDLAKGTIRFQPEKPLPDAAIRALVERRREQIEG
jgi:uncharacterized protein YdhG (YjbR/CyaY superfamily)